MPRDKEESAPRSSSGANKDDKKKTKRNHRHVGPYARAYRAGLAFCPSCDAEKISRITYDEQKQYERDIKPEYAKKR